MSRYGAQFGPDVTFLGVPPCDLDEESTYAGADIVILGAPFDGGTSHRPGTRFGPMAIRTTDYLAHDGSRPSLALRVDGLQDLRVVDAGDVELPPGDIETAMARIEAAVERIARSGAIPLILGGDHSIAFPDAKGVANVLGHGRISMIHFDAHADTGDIEFGSLWGHGQPMRRLIESGALRGDRFLQVGLRGYWPGPETLDWMAAQRMRSYEMTEIVHRGLATCLTCATRATRPAQEPRSLAASAPANCSTRSGGSAWNFRLWASTSSRSARPTTTPTSLPRWPIALSSRRSPRSRANAATRHTGPRGTRPPPCLPIDTSPDRSPRR